MRNVISVAVVLVLAGSASAQSCATGRCAAVAPAYYQVPAQHQYGSPVLIAPQSVTPSPQTTTVVPTVQPVVLPAPVPPVATQPAPAVVTVAPPSYPQFPAPVAYTTTPRRGFRPFGFLGRLFGRR